MSVLLAGKTIGEVYEMLQELKSVKAVAEEIGVTPGAVYNFRSKNHKAFKRLKEQGQTEKQVDVKSNQKSNDYLNSTNEFNEVSRKAGQNISTVNTTEINTKIGILENDNKSQEKKIKKLTSEKNKLHGRITMLEEEIQSISEEKRILKIENQKLSDEKEEYKKQLEELIIESNNILLEARKYREMNQEYQNKIAILSERPSNEILEEIKKIKTERDFYKAHAFMYYQEVNEVS